eukprot:CAMPEP_0181320196 /NCGR_PEP_ID=MMETSP1101-20121128/17989_1 /TAXON_ID=46948 /ORGANISM="Rhodomonas abbreviata, Strain Caron Lab Isolate" /LENGTH=663 /DNA_ID=CAMNT_0023427873 /DNA_START=307 /DNA_END=2297 /DNA_ORIENTATION=-
MSRSETLKEAPPPPVVAPPPRRSRPICSSCNLQKDVNESQKIVGAVLQEKQILQSEIQHLRDNDSDTPGPSGSRGKPRPKVKARFMLMEKNRYKNHACMLCWKILPHVSITKANHILKACLQFCGAENQQLPSDRQLARFIVEMKHLALYQAAVMMGESKYRGFTHDGTTGMDGKMITVSVTGEAKDGKSKGPRVLTLGTAVVSSGEAEEGARAVISLIMSMMKAAEMAGDQETASKINIAMFNVGTQHDHNAGEDKIDDIIEEEVLKWCQENVHKWEKCPYLLQKKAVRLIRHYCFEHKIDNLAKAIPDACDDFCSLGKYLDGWDVNCRHDKPSGANWMHATHKLIGRKGGKEKPGSNPLNIHTEFKDHLIRTDKQAELGMLQSLGCIVGERFWARCKQGALLYSLVGEVRSFLEGGYKAIKKSHGTATENQLEFSVRMLSCFSLHQQKFSEADIARNMIRVLCETRVFGVWHHALMTPALQAAIAEVAVAAGQRPVLRRLHRFLTKMANEPEFRWRVLTEHDVPVTFENFECDGWVGCIPFVGPPSAAQAESYKRIFSRIDWRNIIARQMSQFRKDALNISMEMAQQNGLNPLEEGVEEWTAENVDVKGPELIASSLPLQAAIKKAREAAKEMMVEYPPLDINRLPSDDVRNEAWSEGMVE